MSHAIQLNLLAVVLLALMYTSTLATPPECADPGEIPTSLLSWTIQQPVLLDVTMGHEFVFLTAFNGVQNEVVRYPINGGSSTTWNIDPLELPHDVEINPLNDDLYIASFSSDPRVRVYDVTGTGIPEKVLFGGPRGTEPGEFAGAGFPIAIHPVTGDIYVVDEDTITVGLDTLWVSRIQRFDSNGNYNGFTINNGLGYNPIEDSMSPPVPPACGSWHYAKRLSVDAAGNVYVYEFVDESGDMTYVHKINSSGSCEENWEVTGSKFRVDRGGFVYLCSDSLRKMNPDRTETLYTIGSASNAVSGVEFLAGSSNFMCMISPGQPYELEILGRDIETLNILGSDWQDPMTFQFRTDSLTLLAGCHEDNKPMAGVVADGVSPLLLRWRVPGPGEVTWELADQQLPAETRGLGTVSSIDGLVVDTLSVTTTVELVDDEYIAFAVSTAPVDFDRPGVPSDATVGERNIDISAYYEPAVAQSPPLVSGNRSLIIMRPPVLFLHGLWSKPKTWNTFIKAFEGDNRWEKSYGDYELTAGKSLDYNVKEMTGFVNATKARVDDDIVVSQIDVIAHSMGGILVRKHADSGEYKRKNNMGKGDFHKVLFLDVPHKGSPLANLVVSLRDVMQNSWWPGKRAYVWSMFQIIKGVMGGSLIGTSV